MGKEFKPLEQLRSEFEEMAINKFFDISRNKSGEYSNHSTFYLWAGYWECAVANQVLTEKDADFANIHIFTAKGGE